MGGLAASLVSAHETPGAKPGASTTKVSAGVARCTLAAKLAPVESHGLKGTLPRADTWAQGCFLYQK